MALPAGTHPYFIGALETGPATLQLLLGQFKSEDNIWDQRPDPSRFSLREMVAHIADWNEIYQGRLERTRDEQNPELENCDEGKLAEERNYAQSDPVANLMRYQETRTPLINMVKDLTPEDWNKPAIRFGLGPMTMAEQICLIPAHDAYHIRQAMDCLGIKR
jgi:uncharacterized damage-inducible protein DinB